MNGLRAFFLPLIGGYLLLTHWNHTRYIFRRSAGHKLVFDAATCGFILVVVARVVVELLNQYLPSVGVLWKQFVPHEFSGTAVLALLLGPSSCCALNRYFTRPDGARRAAEEAGDVMELLFVESMERTMLVEVTLQSRKVYIGWVVNAEVAEPERRAIQILPLLSGYRESETQTFVLTTNYAPVYDTLLDENDEGLPDLDWNDFRVVLPIAELRSARLFDFDAYERMGAISEELEDEGASSEGSDGAAM